MKGIDIFCASQAAATTTMDYYHQQPPSSSSSFNGGGPAIDRHNPIIQDQKRLTTTPRPTTGDHHNNKKKSKNPKRNSLDEKRKTINVFADENKDEQLVISDSNNNKDVDLRSRRRQGGVLLKWGCTRPGDFISPATSSRFLLADNSKPPFVSDDQFFDPLLKQVLPPPAPPPPPPSAAAAAEKTYKSLNYINANLKINSSTPVAPPPAETTDNDKDLKKKKKKEVEDGGLPSSPVKLQMSSSNLSSQSSDHQVVVLRVSLHCKGCERKMRKHISKMEGVRSFNIDFMAKKVTVVGDITPLAVLTSVSKVKNAKLLTPTTISSSQPQQTPLLA